MDDFSRDESKSAIFITFSGNCRKALTFYQTLFGGVLHFETFGTELEGFPELPVVSGSLLSNKLAIYGSDLVHSEGRKLGNYIAIFLPCQDVEDRKSLVEKLNFNGRAPYLSIDEHQKLVEVVDAFDVRWVLGI